MAPRPSVAGAKVNETHPEPEVELELGMCGPPTLRFLVWLRDQTLIGKFSVLSAECCP